MLENRCQVETVIVCFWFFIDQKHLMGKTSSACLRFPNPIEATFRMDHPSFFTGTVFRELSQNA